MKIILSILLFCITEITNATTYYISTAGNDATGTGSTTNPWKTLFKATSTVFGKGDIIHVTEGTYIETAQCILALDVSIEGEGINTIIKSTLTADWREMLRLFSAEEGTKGNQHISYLKFDGQNLSTYYGIQIIGRSNVEVHHITMVDFKSNGIFFDGRTDNLNLAPTIYSTGNSFHDNIVHNCAGYNLSTGEYGRGALNIGGQKDLLVYNNTITQNERPDGYNGFPIKYSLNGHNKGLKIYNNIITKIPFAGTFGGDHGWDFSIELWHCEGGLEIYENTFQGALDLVHVAKHSYPFGAWVHDNKISQPTLNKHYETGILFEKGVESAIIENNTIDKCSSGVEVFCEYYPNNELGEPDNPYNPIIDLIIRNNRFTHISNGFGIHIASGPKIIADMHDVYIYNNIISGDSIGKPYWGIAIQEVLKATNIQIHHNTIENFSAASIFINPAALIDSLLIENNILSGNGYGNRPSFNSGKPRNYIFKKNKTRNGIIVSFTNVKMNFVRPLYYTLKSLNLLELITFLAAVCCIWFCSNENIYTYPMGLIYAVANIFLSLDYGIIGEIFINSCFIAMAIYGWALWTKRDKRKHRIIRITTSKKRDWIFYLLFFIVTFITFSLYRSNFNNDFSVGSIPLADTLISATAFTGMWLTVKKKVEGWYWWIVSFTLSVIIYFETNYIYKYLYYAVFFSLSLWALYKWKKKRANVRKREV